MDWINIGLALLTIALGLFGFLAPRYTADALDLATTKSTMGLSELRASAGGLFVAMGVTCLFTMADWAFFMLGIAYAGAALGRLVALVLDNPPWPKGPVFFLFEAIPAAVLIGANIPGA